jgi:hypothetical protein
MKRIFKKIDSFKKIMKKWHRKLFNIKMKLIIYTIKMLNKKANFKLCSKVIWIYYKHIRV